MNLHLLEMFCQVVETGSFALTADSRYVSRSAVSIQIHRLEAEFGVALLERVQGFWRPTAAGRAVYAHAQKMLGQRDVLLHEIQALRAGTTSLMVGASPTGVLNMVADGMTHFLDRHPEVNVCVDVDAPKLLLEKLGQDQVRLAFEWGPLAPPGVTAMALMPCDFPLVVSASHAYAHKKVSKDQLAHQTLYCLRHGRQALSPVEEALIAARISPEMTVRLPSVDAIKTMVKTGRGMTILSRASLREELARNDLSEVTVEDFSLRRPLTAMWKTDRPLSEDEKAFIQAVGRVAQQFC